MEGKLFAVYQVPTQRMFAVGQAARYLGLNKQTLRQLTDLGTIAAKRVNGRRMFRLEDLDKWIDSQPDWIEKDNRIVEVLRDGDQQAERQQGQHENRGQQVAALRAPFVRRRKNY